MTKSGISDVKHYGARDTTAADKFWTIVSIIAAGLAFFLALWVF